MRVTRVYFYILALLFMTACVERYYPETDDLFTGTLVINATLTNLPGIQTFQISRSDGLIYPEFIPEPGCLVGVENQDGDQLSFDESEPGYYSTIVPEAFMRVGNQYRLRVITAGGKVYQSEYSRLNSSTAIDRVYYEMEPHPTSDPEERILGFFGVSGLSEKRYFVREVEGLVKYDVLHCFPQSEPPRFRYLMTMDLPVYLSRAADPLTGAVVFGETKLECLDCRARKGSTGDPPDFWPLDWKI